MNREEIIALGKQVKEKRLQLGMTQTEFAKSIGIGFSTLQALELGKSITIGNRIRSIVENYLDSSHVAPAVGNICDSNYSSFLLRIAKIVIEPDFPDRVKGVAELLRIEPESAAFEVLDKDLKKMT